MIRVSIQPYATALARTLYLKKCQSIAANGRGARVCYLPHSVAMVFVSPRTPDFAVA